MGSKFCAECAWAMEEGNSINGFAVNKTRDYLVSTSVSYKRPDTILRNKSKKQRKAVSNSWKGKARIKRLIPLRKATGTIKFRKAAARRSRGRWRNKECRARMRLKISIAVKKAWRNKKARKKYNFYKIIKRLAKYGLTRKDFNRMKKKCGNRCEICYGLPQRTILSLDHDHKTNKVRGLVCESCNFLLGWIEKVGLVESVRAITYLVEHSTCD